MITTLLALPTHGSIGNIEEVGYYDELFFLFIGVVLLSIVGMSWFFVRTEGVGESSE